MKKKKAKKSKTKSKAAPQLGKVISRLDDLTARVDKLEQLLQNDAPAAAEAAE